MKVIRIDLEVTVSSYDDKYKLDELLEERLNDIVSFGGSIVNVQSSIIQENYGVSDDTVTNWWFTQHHMVIADLPVGHPYR